MSCPADHKHNSTCYTGHKCRCERCTAAVTDLQRRRRERPDLIVSRRYKFTEAQLEIARRVYGV